MWNCFQQNRIHLLSATSLSPSEGGQPQNISVHIIRILSTFCHLLSPITAIIQETKLIDTELVRDLFQEAYKHLNQLLRNNYVILYTEYCSVFTYSSSSEVRWYFRIEILMILLKNSLFSQKKWFPGLSLDYSILMITVFKFIFV